jgi:hypothetical protein
MGSSIGSSFSGRTRTLGGLRYTTIAGRLGLRGLRYTTIACRLGLRGRLAVCTWTHIRFPQRYLPG